MTDTTFNAAAEADAASRALGRRTDPAADGPGMRVSTIARTYPTTVDDLWEAVTLAERIGRWFTPISGDLELGGRYELQGNASGTVESCDPPHHYRATWEYGGAVSWIEVSVAEDPDAGARLTLEHIGDVPDEFWTQFGPGATGVGWDLGLLGLAWHLAGREGMTPEEAEAWTLSDEGVAFVKASAARWADAHVADGATREEADAAAAGTIAFYTTPPA